MHLQAAAACIAITLGLGLGPVRATAAPGDISVERGAHVAVTSGCHDCHTAGYSESGGHVDAVAALRGSPIGYQGPWGTTYPSNLRLVTVQHAANEDAFVAYLKQLETRPPMPWYNARALDESDMRSLYRYISSLGESGPPAPDALPPGVMPDTPYIVFAPPITPR